MDPQLSFIMANQGQVPSLELANLIFFKNYLSQFSFWKLL